MTAIAQPDSITATIEGVNTKLDSARLAKSVSRKRLLDLTDLPLYVRNNIYKFALDTEYVNIGKPNVSYTHSIQDGLLHFKSSRPPFPILTSLFYINKQISKEALKYFYSKNLFIRFEIYSADARHVKTMLEDSGLLFSPASTDMLDHSKQHAMEVVLVEKNSSLRRGVVMFPAQYLPRLINFLDQARRASAAWAPAHSLFLNVVNTYDFPISRLQGDLLELFRLLSNLGAATVDSNNLLPRYAEGLQANMTASEFTAETLMETATELADLADEARAKEDYALANEFAQCVVIGLTYGYLTHAEALHSQPEEFAKSVQRLRWRIELGTGIALSLQHRSITAARDWLGSSKVSNRLAARSLLLAETSVSKALSLATDSPSPSSNPWFLSLPIELIPPNKPTWFTDLEKAQTWYALGTVHAALGENLFAAGDLERSLELWGSADGKGKVQNLFEKVRQAIDGNAQDMFTGKVRPGSGLKSATRLAKMV